MFSCNLFLDEFWTCWFVLYCMYPPYFSADFVAFFILCGFDVLFCIWFSFDYICIWIFLICEMSLSNVGLFYTELLWDINTIPLLPYVLLWGRPAVVFLDFWNESCCYGTCWFIKLLLVINSSMLWFWFASVFWFWFEAYRAIYPEFVYAICPALVLVFLALPPLLVPDEVCCCWRGFDGLRATFCWELFFCIFFYIWVCCCRRYCCCFMASWDYLTFFVAELY